MGTLSRLLIFLGLAWLTYVLFREARIANAREDMDASRVVLLFGGVVLVGGTAGVLFAILVMPSFGDWVGNFFFQPNVQIERDPHTAAVAAVARGDYALAVEEYREMLERNPEDTLSYSEIAKISCEHLDDAPGAAQALEDALQREWPQEDAAFLTARLVDVYWKFQHDARSARALLLQIIETMPGTRHAANAEHRLKEIEHQIALEG
jgi:tetratricopeptide (TPR) repeat protein